jgi:hypothetical protein
MHLFLLSAEDKEFTKWLLKVGDGKNMCQEHGTIQLHKLLQRTQFL